MRLAITPRVRNLLGCTALLLCAACTQSEAEREAESMKAAIPQRLEPDGSIALSDSDRAALDLTVTPATERELPDVVTRFGRVRAKTGEEVLVASPVAGLIARTPPVQLGTVVRPADALLDLVPVLSAAEQVTLGVRGAELRGQIEGARLELATDRTALDRAKALATSNIVSQAKLQEAEAAVATTRARLAALERAAKVQGAGGAARVTLRAPSAGTVATLNAPVGGFVQQGALLVRLLEPGPRWIEVSAAPSEPAGAQYEVEVGTAWAPARLVARGLLVEPDGSRHDRLQIDGPLAAQLVPGQTVTVRVAVGAGRGIVLPESAIVPGVGTDLVFVETAPGSYAPRPVRIAARLGGEVRLASGVRDGEKVVTRGAMALQGEARRGQLPQGE